jgi:hypothetical protein
MRANVAVGADIFKHVFEACRVLIFGKGPCRWRLIDIDQMFGFRTHDRLYSNKGANVNAKGTHMTVIDSLAPPARMLPYCGEERVIRRPRRRATVRPVKGAVAYRGTGVKVSRAAHRPRPVSVTMTIILAGLAALITVWLMSLAQSRAADISSTSVSDHLGVVQVQPGENLQRLAARIAPGAPIGSVVERIRELNKLDSAALDAGQTLLVPVG